VLPIRDFVKIGARYSRSVNVERDLDLPQAVEGYLPTPRALDALSRIGRATLDEHAVRAWSITSVYGTGKSAFAQFLASLYGARTGPVRRIANDTLRAAFDEDRGCDRAQRAVLEKLIRTIPSDGFVRAVATCSREPVGRAILRALANGANRFWAHRAGRRPAVVQELDKWLGGHVVRPVPTNETVLRLLHETAVASGSGVLVVLDELGKALEAAAASVDASDLYLLQQVAEASANATTTPVLFVTLQHQEFSAYAGLLGQLQQQEWEKVSGRFEHIPFQEPPEEMLRLVSKVLTSSAPPAISRELKAFAAEWHEKLSTEMSHPYFAEVLTASRIRALYPLHPVAAIALPSLCARFAQNDRSLFSFLASAEPHSLARFVAENAFGGDEVPVLQLPELYDYFVAAAGGGGATHLQRWIEVHSAIAETVGLTLDEQRALKAVGTLNLVASSGPLRASRALVVAALSKAATSKAERTRWTAALDGLVNRGALTYRERIDEYRLWEGTDFDVRAEVSNRIAHERRPLAQLLDLIAPQASIVAERHSYNTGTLRLFDPRFADDVLQLETLSTQPQRDGVVVYWVSETPLRSVPNRTSDGKPLVIVPIGAPDGLRNATHEVAALLAIIHDEPALKTDGVARKEVQARLRLAEQAVQAALREGISRALGPEGETWIGEHRRRLGGRRALNGALSDLCDTVYHESPIFRNELLNRRELTSQGARARRELLEAMLLHGSEERLGLTGDGPEASMYQAALSASRVHASRDGTRFTFGRPSPKSGLVSLWNAIESFCVGARSEARPLDGLYSLLAAPPYGVKAGSVPVFLAAVLIAHSEDISVYRDGTFLPILAAEHFELLVKNPTRFRVRSFALNGINADVFRALAEVMGGERRRPAANERNMGLLSVVRPLVRFANALPAFTRRTEKISTSAIALREALTVAREPDELIFSALPMAVGLAPVGPTGAPWEVAIFRQRVQGALRELQNHVERTLDHCRGELVEAFGIRSSADRLREDLRVRAQYLSGRVVEPRLRHFVQVAIDADASDLDWITAISMVIADRPVESWSDADADAFELQVADLARRFQTLEALQRESVGQREAADVRRVSLTDAGGREILGLIWIDDHEREKMNRLASKVEKFLADLPTAEMREAVAVKVLEGLMTNRAGSAEAVPLRDTSTAERTRKGRASG
jgi:hypothetical protein